MPFTRIKAAMALTLSAAMLLSAAACGTTDDSDASGKASGSSSIEGYDVSSVAKDESIAKLLPESVTKDGKFTVGMDLSYPPAEFLAADGKTPVGFDVDLVKAMAKEFGLTADPQNANFDSIIPSVGAKYDIGISSFTITPERLKAVDFVTIFKSGSAWVVRKGNPNKVDVSDVCGLKVTVQTATIQEEEVNKLNEQCKADGKKAIDVLSNKLQTDVTTNVTTGKATGMAKEAVAVKKGDTATAQAVQKALQKLIDDGTYMKILKHWGVESGAIDKSEINPIDVND